MKQFIFTFCLVSIFISCSNIFPDKHLQEKTFKSKDITVNWYTISDITSSHFFVDLTRGGYTTTIMKSNDYGIYDVVISEDTITIRTISGLTIYQLSAKALQCYIKLDSTVTIDQYRDKLKRDEGK